MLSVTISVIQDEITPTIEALIARLRAKTSLLQTLGWMAKEHVNDRFLGGGRSRKFGAGPQPKWEPLHDVSYKIRRWKASGPSMATVEKELGWEPGQHTQSRWIGVGRQLWADSNKAASPAAMQILRLGADDVEVGWQPGAFKNDYPYIIDGGGEEIAVECTKGMVPGKTIMARPLLYFTDPGFTNEAIKALWTWLLEAIGIRTDD